MRHWSAFVLILLCVLALLGCGRDLAGTYDAGVRLQEGKQESTDAGYTLADVRAKLRAEPRSIVLKADGRYEMRNAEFVEMGAWRVEGDTLFLRGDISNGVHIQPALQKDRTFRLNAIDQIVDDGSYGHYQLELVYERE
jgi:hypothetical protein